MLFEVTKKRNNKSTLAYNTLIISNVIGGALKDLTGMVVVGVLVWMI